MQHVLSCLITLIFLACLWWKDLLNFKNLSICQLLLCLPLLHQECIPISSLAPIIHITQNRSCLQDRPTKMFIHCSFSHFCLEPTLYNTTSLWCYGHHIITVLKDVRYLLTKELAKLKRWWLIYSESSSDWILCQPKFAHNRPMSGMRSAHSKALGNISPRCVKELVKAWISR